MRRKKLYYLIDASDLKTNLIFARELTLMTAANCGDWLKTFAVCETPINGAIVIANMYASLLECLMSPDDIKAFIKRCIASSSGDPAQQFQDTCTLNEPSKLSFLLRKGVDIAQVHPNDRWVHVVTGDTFIFRLLSQTYRNNPIGSFAATVLPREPLNDDDDRVWAETLNYFATHTVDWAEPGSHLGKPYDAPPSNWLKTCWVTELEPVDAAVASYSLRTKQADRIRDILGLIHYGEGPALVKLSFPVRVILDCSPRPRVAQPSFCDAGGHRRFAARLVGASYETNRRKEWGTTVDLLRFKHGESDVCGLPERVVEPIPLTSARFEPEYLGRIMENRGDTGQDDDHEFARWLCQEPKLDQMLDYISRAIA